MNFFKSKIYPVIHKCVSGLRESFRVWWYKKIKDRLYPYETIMDEHNAHLYCTLSMSALLIDNTNERVLKMAFNQHIREIRYIPDDVIMISIISCKKLERIACDYPSGLRRLEIESCYSLCEVPEIPDSLLFWWQICNNDNLERVYYYTKESIQEYKVKKRLKKFLT